MSDLVATELRGGSVGAERFENSLCSNSSNLPEPTLSPLNSVAALVNVAFSSSEKQWIIPVNFVENTNVEQVINESGILQEVPDIDLTTTAVGIFGRKCKLETIVQQGDRIEIYRDLVQNPMEARRNRARAKG